MPFQEKSAWIMSLALLLGGIFYFRVVVAMSSEIGELDGNLFFYSVFASLMISQLVEYGMQIFLYRTTV